MLLIHQVHAPVSSVTSLSTTQSTVGASPVYGMMRQLSPSAPVYMGAHLPLPSSVGSSSSIHKEEHSFPERPGQPECQYYVKTGDCKFGSSCRYHHPPGWSSSRTNFSVSPMGLPLHPGTPLCAHYVQNGVCKYGPACRFNHPMGSPSYSSSTSLTDLPVASYPNGSSKVLLTSSSSSSVSVGSILSKILPSSHPSEVRTSS
ncbi:hypothetical protein U1Q18_030010 [Sarracenia purpurea var. burkii]